MQVFKLEERLVGKGVALAESRGMKVFSDVIYDGPHEYGYTPAEIIMNGLASCILINTQNFATKMKIDFKDLRVAITAYRQEKQPPTIVKMEYKLFIKTNAPQEKVNKVLYYALKYSTVYNTLKNAVEITGYIESEPLSSMPPILK
jgi:putative redox protein